MARKQKKAGLSTCRTRAEKDNAQKAYFSANRAVKKSIKADNKKFVNQLATEAEEAARIGNMKSFYNTTKLLSRKFSKTERLVRDKRGNPIQEKKGQKNIWKEHFEELLNRSANQHPPVVTPADRDLPIECKESTKKEIWKAIQQLKSNKAARKMNKVKFREIKF